MQEKVKENLEGKNFCELFKSLQPYFIFKIPDIETNVVDFINHLLGKTKLHYENDDVVLALPNKKILKYSTVSKYYASGILLCTSNHAKFVISHLNQKCFYEYLTKICPKECEGNLRSFYNDHNISIIENNVHKTTFNLIKNSIINCQHKNGSPSKKTAVPSSSMISPSENSAKNSYEGYTDNDISQKADASQQIIESTHIPVIIGTDRCYCCKYWKENQDFRQYPEIDGFCVIKGTTMSGKNKDICNHYVWERCFPLNSHTSPFGLE